MGNQLLEIVDNRVGQVLDHVEAEVGYKPVKVAAWGLAAASLLAATAAAFAAAAAVAGAYLAVRKAIEVSKTGCCDSNDGFIVIEDDESDPDDARAADELVEDASEE